MARVQMPSLGSLIRETGPLQSAFPQAAASYVRKVQKSNSSIIVREPAVASSVFIVPTRAFRPG